jgi:hypothetical protein
MTGLSTDPEGTQRHASPSGIFALVPGADRPRQCSFFRTDAAMRETSLLFHGSAPFPKPPCPLSTNEENERMKKETT